MRIPTLEGTPGPSQRVLVGGKYALVLLIRLALKYLCIEDGAGLEVGSSNDLLPIIVSSGGCSSRLVSCLEDPKDLFGLSPRGGLVKGPEGGGGM